MLLPGECCIDCQFKAQGILCRPKMEATCDVEEYCTGLSEHCPVNKFAPDYVPCKNNASFCFRGQCNTQDDQCRLVLLAFES